MADKVNLVNLTNKQSLQTILTLFLVGSLLSCATAPKKAKQTSANVEQVYKVEAKRPVPKNSQVYLTKAESLPQAQAAHFYQQAAAQALIEKRPIEYVQKILNKINPTVFTHVERELELAKLYLAVDMVEQGRLIIARLEKGHLPKRLQMNFRLLKAQLASASDDHIQAVRQLFQLQNLFAHALSADDKHIIANLVWRHLLLLPEISLNRFASDFGAVAQPWTELANVINENVHSINSIKQQLQIWQKRYPTFAASSQVPEEIRQLLTTSNTEIKHILVLLPFSGKLAEEAKHIRNGFLTALGGDDEIQLTFVDSSQLDIAELQDTVSNKQVDMIVGPLQKDKVELLQNSELFQQLPILFLNKPDLIPQQHHLRIHSYYFALSPEDEVQQAVEYFISNDIKHPTLIYADNSLGKRLVNEFDRQWHALTDTHPESIAFTSKTQLKKTVQDLLDVSKSDERIKEMQRLFGASLKTETRSRMDIDAVYVIANSRDTRLIKPFFDVNVSTFGERLPVYSSSRSYLVGETRAQKRDLNGLTFTEMPWLIKGTSPEVDAVYQQVGINQTQLKKLFAFGYDAFNLLSMLPTLSVLSDYQVKALTGKLSINEDKTIKRTLDWSQYRQGKIIAVN